MNPSDSPQDLELSVRAGNVLKNANVTTIAQLVQMTGEDLLKLEHMGSQALENIRQGLAFHGLRLADGVAAAPVKNGAKTTPAFEAQKGKGRPKGVVNKTTTLLKDAILAAAAKAGGKDGIEGYLAAQAERNPQSFLPLLGKVLPMQITGEGEGPLVIEIRKPGG